MRRREALPYLQKTYAIGERRACRVLRVCRATVQYRSVKIDVAPLRARIVELARLRLRYGYRRIHVLLRREGWAVNVKRVHRLYRQEGLSMRLRPPKRRRAASRPTRASTDDRCEPKLVDGFSVRYLGRWPAHPVLGDSR